VEEVMEVWALNDTHTHTQPFYGSVEFWHRMTMEKKDWARRAHTCPPRYEAPLAVTVSSPTNDVTSATSCNDNIN